MTQDFFSITQGCSEVFCNVGYYRECRRHEPFRGVWGYPPPENFQVRRLQNAICSTCHEICLRKIDLQDENGKQLQITVIKITESKENKSIHRLDLSGSTGPGEAAALRLCYHVELTWLIFLWHTHRLKASDWGCCGLNYSSAIPATSFCLSNTSSSCSRSLWSSSIYIKVHYIGNFVHYLIVITLRTIYV